MTNGREQGSGDRQMAESQLSELQNMRVLLEEARGLSRNLAYHRRARLEARLGDALDEVDRQIVELRADRGSWRSSSTTSLVMRYAGGHGQAAEHSQRRAQSFQRPLARDCRVPRALLTPVSSLPEP